MSRPALLSPALLSPALALLVALVLALTSSAAGAAPGADRAKPRKAYAVTLAAASTSVVAGGSVALSGKVTPKAKGARVDLQRRLGSGRWTTVARPTLSRTSRWSATSVLPSAGSWSFRVVKAKAGKRRAGASATRVVVARARVTPTPTPTPVPTPTPTPTPAPVVWRSVSAGGQHTCGVKSNGTMWCWGLNNTGQLGSAAGFGTTTAVSTPQQVGTSTSWESVTAGVAHSCGVMTDHSAWCWGANTRGQLGNAVGSGGSQGQVTPLRVGGTALWSMLSSGGGDTTCGLQVDRSAWCWGNNSSGQLGDGTVAVSSSQANPSPRQVGASIGAVTDWVDIDAGFTHTCGRRAGGTLWCWGANGAGKIGDGTTTDRPVPTQVSGSLFWTDVATGDQHTCARQEDQSTWCWGLNTSRQLASGSVSSATTPVRVGTGASWNAITAGSSHTCGLEFAGMAYCWGSRDAGGLGDGGSSSGSSATPEAVAGGRHFAGIESGDKHTCAVALGGTAWCWGSNFYGQLGNPTNAGSSSASNPVPLQVG